MAVRVKEGGGKRWVERSSIAAESYVKGAENPRVPWAQATAEGENNWKLGVNEAASKGSFAKGVKKAGDATWLKGIKEKGAMRFAAGVALAEDKYNSGIAPYLDTLKGLTLPKRGKKGDPNNISRVSAVTQALHAKKLQLKG